MPAIPTEPTPSVQNTGSASLATASFTPAANALITAYIATRDTTDLNYLTSIAATFGLARGWILETEDLNDLGSTNRQRMLIATCVTNGAPGAGVITATFAGVQSEIQLQISQIDSDFDLEAPVRQSNQYNPGAFGEVTPNESVRDNVLTTSMMLAGAAGAPEDTSILPYTGYTELGEHDTTTMQSNMQYRTGSTSPVFGVEWGTFNHSALAAIEVEAPHTHVGRPIVLAPGQRTLLGSTTHQNNVNVLPLANSRVFVTAYWNDGASFVSLSQPWGPWTTHIISAAYGSENVRCGIFSCDAGSSPAAGAPVLTVGASVGKIGYDITQVIGRLHATTPVRQTLEQGHASLAGGTPISQTFGLAPLAGSHILAIAVGCDNDRWGPATPGAGYVKPRQPDEEGGGVTEILFFTNVEGHSNSVSTTLGTNTPGDDQPNGAVMVAVEIQAAEVSSDIISRMPHPYTRWID
jgi:hypothetical protein